MGLLLTAKISHIVLSRSREGADLDKLSLSIELSSHPNFAQSRITSLYQLISFTMSTSVASVQISPHPKDTYFYVLFVFQQNGWAQPFSTTPHLWRGCQHGRHWCQSRARGVLQRTRTHHQHGNSEGVSLTWLVRKSSAGGPPVDAAALLLSFGKVQRGEEGCSNWQKLSVLLEGFVFVPTGWISR